jgi:hypothetical protein
VTYYDAPTGIYATPASSARPGSRTCSTPTPTSAPFSSAAVVGDSLHVVYQRLSDHTMRFLTHSAFH